MTEQRFANMPRNLFSIKLSRPAAWQVLGIILSYADPDGCNAWPLIETIMKDTGLSRRCVYYAIAELSRIGLVTRRRRGHRSSVYAVNKKLTANDVNVHGIGNRSVHGIGNRHLPRSCTQTKPVDQTKGSDSPDGESAPSSALGAPSRLFERVIRLLAEERGEKGARTLAVKWWETFGEEYLQMAIEDAEADADDRGYTSVEFFIDWFMGGGNEVECDPIDLADLVARIGR